MIALEWLEEIVKYSIASAYVKDEVPVSIMVISEIEAGKSMVLSKFAQVPSVIFQTDFTRYGLLKEWLPALQRKTKRTVIVSDIVALMETKNQVGRGALVGFLNSLVEEGISNIQTFNLSYEFKEPLRCNIIIGAPKTVVDDRRRWRGWANVGFVSRLLPITYRYSQDIVTEILEYVYKLNYRDEIPTDLVLPEEDVAIKMSPSLSKELSAITQQIAKAVGTYGFRIQRQAQTLAMARALLLGRDEVVPEDVQRINQLLAWANLKFEPVGLREDKIYNDQPAIDNSIGESKAGYRTRK